MQNQNKPKKMKVLLYTGFTLVFLPVAMVIILVIASKSGSSHNSKENSVSDSIKEEKPIIEKKIIYDTVRVEISVPKPKKKKVKTDSLNIIQKDSAGLITTPNP